MSRPFESFLADKLDVQVYDSRRDLGQAAAESVAGTIISMLQESENINMIFAAAPSQNEFLENLIANPSIEWNRIRAFHMDEYIGLQADAPQCFGTFLKHKLFDLVPFANVHFIQPETPEKECERYAKLLEDFPPDIVCLGIGENGHLAFNDPPVADFTDPKLVKIVELEAACIQQQVNDGCFESIESVPKTAITLTIPALMSAKHLCCVVPGSTKREAVKNTLHGPITTACPASILRTHSGASLYLDKDSYTDSR